MQTYQPSDIRNFAIVGHASSGKTMLSEAMLVCGGVIHRMGSIAGATTVSDYHESERQRKIFVVNAMDKENADFDKILAQAKERFGSHVFPMNLPINPGPGFNQVLDVLRSELVTYARDASGKFQEVPAAGPWEERVKQLHKELIEHIAESDDSLLEKFFDQGGLSEEELRANLHAAVQKQMLIPIFCASGETNVGVARLMDFIAKYRSSPVDLQHVNAPHPNHRHAELSSTAPYPTL